MERTVELKDLGAQLKALRAEKGLTQSALAAICNFDKNYIGMLERGERNPTYMSLLAIANGLHVPVKNLIPETSCKPSMKEQTNA